MSVVSYILKNGASKGRSAGSFNQTQLRIGAQHEMEHTSDYRTAQRIAMDHLTEDPIYYTKLARAGLGDDAPPCKAVPCIATECKQGISGWMLVAIALAGFGLNILKFQKDSL